MLLLSATGLFANQVYLMCKGGSVYDWWFEPMLVGLSSADEQYILPTTITNYADIITYSAFIKPIAFQFGYNVVESNRTEQVKYYSINGYIDVDADTGEGISVAMGNDTIRMVSPTVTRDMQVEANASPPGYYGYVEDLEEHQYLPNSVKEHVNTNMLALIQGHDGSEADLAIYSVQDHAATNYIRNTNCWAYGLDLTCCSPWNSTGDGAAAGKRGLPSGQFRAATAITSRHVLSSNHYHLLQNWGNNPDGELRFVTQDNQVITRHAVGYTPVRVPDATITNMLSIRAIESMAYTNVGSADYVVLRLDEELPDSITPAKRLPDDWMSYIPYTQGFTNEFNNKRFAENYPLVMTDAEERATIAESMSIGLHGGLTYQPDYGGYSTWSFNPPGGWLFQRRDTYFAFYRDKIVGDSSSPVLLYINGEPVLTGTLTMGGGGAAFCPAVFCSQAIQAAISGFGDTNIWEAVDLSGFRTFERVD